MKRSRASCVYLGCKLKCRNEEHHRAKYASIMYQRRKRIKNVEKERSKKINWEVLKNLGILI